MYQRVIKVCLHGDDSKYFPMFRSVSASEDFTIQYIGYPDNDFGRFGARVRDNRNAFGTKARGRGAYRADI